MEVEEVEVVSCRFRLLRLPNRVRKRSEICDPKAEMPASSMTVEEKKVSMFKSLSDAGADFDLFVNNCVLV